MLHEKRTWRLAEVASADELAEMLAGVGAVVAMDVRDLLRSGAKTTFRLREKGGKYLEIPAQHLAAEYVVAGRGRADSALRTPETRLAARDLWVGTPWKQMESRPRTIALERPERRTRYADVGVTSRPLIVSNFSPMVSPPPPPLRGGLGGVFAATRMAPTRDG